MVQISLKHKSTTTRDVEFNKRRSSRLTQDYIRPSAVASQR